MCGDDKDCPLDGDNPVTELLCQARREAMLERIEGLKKAIYVSSATVGIILTVLNLILALVGK